MIAVEDFDMTALGFVLLLIGATLVVAEAHVPGGVLGMAGGLALIAGGVIVIAALGGGAALAVPVGVGLGAAAGGWALVVTRKTSGARHVRIQAGAEALCGRVGVVRRWSEPAGHVFIDGALWRARHESVDSDQETLHEGEHVVVERVSGLTLSVRKAEAWELIS
jgi:membrane protein implicated in regulation of membrane protease activity